MPALSPRFNQEKLDMSPPSMRPWKMTPPTLSPLHMTPPNMLLPNFSPPSLPLPYLRAFEYFPPQAVHDEVLPQGPTVMAYSREDPTLLAIGTSEAGTPERPAGGGSVMLYRVYDVEKKVRGDIHPPDPPRQKIRPDMEHLKTIQTSGAVLDVKFCPREGMRDLVYASTSDGKILIFQVRMRNNGAKTLKLKSTQRVFPERGPHQIRKIAFNPEDEFILAVACSNYASVALLEFEDVTDDDNFNVLSEFKASNKGIVRTVVFSRDGTRVYTGGDDGALREWNVTNASQPALSWQDTESHEGEPITCIVVWPDPYGADANAKRKAILTGSYDGIFRHFDMSHRLRPPPLKEEHRLEEERERAGEAGGAIWCMVPLPPLPVILRRHYTDEELPIGVYSPESTSLKSRELDPDEVGLVVCSASGMARLLVQRQNFHQVFIGPPPSDEQFDELFRSPDGVKLDWEGREQEFTWYTVVVFKEHFEKNHGVPGPQGGGVYAGTAVSLVDWDPMFKDSGDQRKRRGWRVVTSSYGDHRMLMLQGYVD